MKWICLVFCTFNLSALTKSELKDQGYDHLKEAAIDVGVGTAKLGLAAYQLVKGDLYGSLYMQVEASVTLSEAVTEMKESYKCFKSAVEFREERENDTHD